MGSGVPGTPGCKPFQPKNIGTNLGSQKLQEGDIINDMGVWIMSHDMLEREKIWI